jgi:hypothetical protein
VLGAPPQKDSVYLSVCAIYKDEARYLREWIEFHRLVGVERFFLYDNGSTDDHLNVLAPYIEEGTVFLRRWFVPEQAQNAAYDDCLRRRFRELVRPEDSRDLTESRWIAFIDIDEFLFSPTGWPLPEILPKFEAHPGVGVNTVVFGTSGHEQPPPGLVIENYVYRAAEHAGNIKSIVDPQRTLHCYGAHHFHYLQPTSEVDGVELDRVVFVPAQAVNENHDPIPDSRTLEFSCSLLRINHYWTKAEQEFRRKWSQTRADTGGLRKELSDEHMRYMNSVKDDTVQIYLPALRKAMARSGLLDSFERSDLR